MGVVYYIPYYLFITEDSSSSLSVSLSSCSDYGAFLEGICGLMPFDQRLWLPHLLTDLHLVLVWSFDMSLRSVICKLLQKRPCFILGSLYLLDREKYTVKPLAGQDLHPNNPYKGYNNHLYFITEY